MCRSLCPIPIHAPYVEVKSGKLSNKFEQLTVSLSKPNLRLIYIYFSTNSASYSETYNYAYAPSVVCIDGGITKYDTQAALFFCKYEIAYIQQKKISIMYAILTIISIAMAILITSWSTTLLIGLAIHLIAFNFFIPTIASEADDWAIKKSSTKELKGALRLFEARNLANNVCKFPSYFTHQSNAVRMAKIENALKETHQFSEAGITEVKKSKKVELLKQYFILKNTDPNYQP